MDIMHGSGWDARWRCAPSETYDTSEGEGEFNPSSASASDSNPYAAWGKEETSMEARERLCLEDAGEKRKWWGVVMSTRTTRIHPLPARLNSPARAQNNG